MDDASDFDDDDDDDDDDSSAERMSARRTALWKKTIPTLFNRGSLPILELTRDNMVSSSSGINSRLDDDDDDDDDFSSAIFFMFSC